ncbi:MAG: prohibitin family protein [Cytophagaceae bacterium]|nr:prohibitin family protein [Cytophagaceae bacterium]
MYKNLLIIVLGISMLTSCMVVRPGEVGYIQTSGKLSEKSRKDGIKPFNFFVSKPVKINIRVVEVYENLVVPSKEGLSIHAEISLLYHIDPERAKDVYTMFGKDYEEVAIKSNLRATTREICARYEAKELYATERVKIEEGIAQQLREHISQWGFIIDAVLLKDIVMPKEITQAIEEKVEAEQATLTMDYIIAKQKKEAERMMIEAEAIKKSQEIINQAMNSQALQYRYIEMLKSLGLSPNSKILLLDKQSPVLVNP